MTTFPRVCALLQLFAAWFVVLIPSMSWASPMVIAKDGAAGGFIENTLTALPLAISDRVDFIELRLLSTKDNQLIVFKDLTLNRLSDVADRFPDRHRPDGGFYVADFTLNEIRQLRLRNVFDNGPAPLTLSIPTFAEELSLVFHLDNMFNRQTGLVVEPGYPEFHRAEGKNISAMVLDALQDLGVLQKIGNRLYLQSHDPDELQQLKENYLARLNLDIPLIQVIERPLETTDLQSQSFDYAWIFTNSGLHLVASYASALALPGPALINSDGTMQLTGFIQEAHGRGLKILATSLPEIDSDQDSTPVRKQLDDLFEKVLVDGVYTDDFRSVLKYQQEKEDELRRKEDLPPFFSTLELARPKHRNQQEGQYPSPEDQPADSASMERF